MKIRHCIALALALLAASSLIHANEHAHVHGTASLNIIIDGNQIVFDLESPLDSFLGFEHVPVNVQQRQAASNLRIKLNKSADLFVINSEAGCTQGAVTLESTALRVDAKPVQGEHRDLDASFSFVCANPVALREADIRLFAAFPRLKSLKVGIASSKGQHSLQLDPNKRRITF